MGSRSMASLPAGSQRRPRRSPKKSQGFIRRWAAPVRRTKSPPRYASSLRPKLPTSPDKSWWSMEATFSRRIRTAELAAHRLPESRRCAKLGRAYQSLEILDLPLRRLSMCRALSLLVLLLAPFCLRAQQENNPNPASLQVPGSPVIAETKTAPRPRPKIGVALEGGGALGLAHIGVLKWFEEHRIPVDYVAGTSMGGLVGGFYAAGMNPDELKTLIEGLDWRKILGDRPLYEDLSFRRKEDQRAYPNSLIFGLRHGLSAPPGLIPGHQIGLLIDRVTLPYGDVTSFDALAVPFRCVATDLVSRKSHVFKDGSLAGAMRATMSIPGAFSPVHEGQAVYVDGGLLNNLPTDVVRQMGAEIVIAVHLETAPVEGKDIQSIFPVLEQSVRVVLETNELRGMEQADAVVSVHLAEFSTIDYTKSELIMQRGHEAANERARLLEAFALDNAGWEEHMRAREARKRREAPVPKFIQVEGTNAYGAVDVARYLKSFEGKPLDPQKL